MARLRILHVSTRLIIGGSQENTVLSCEGHVEHGHETHLAFGPIYGPEGSMLERVQRFRGGAAAGGADGADGADRAADATEGAANAARRAASGDTGGGRIVTHEAPGLVRELNPRLDLAAHWQLRRLILRLRPDVVHTHSSKAGILGRAAAWSLLRRGKWRGAVIHTVHGPPFHRYERAWRNRLYVAAERFAARRCHAIVCVADAMREQFIARRIGRAEQYRVIRSGMETAAYLEAIPATERARRRAEFGLGEGDVVVGTVARLSELKGHDDLVAAAAPMLERDPRLRLLWVGDGWLRERLEADFERRGLRERVTITGVAPPERVPGLVKLMDVLVHPSYREGLPRTVVQALLSGVPVVASAADGTPEAVEDGVTGRLFEVGDVDGLRGGLAWMLADAARARATAEAGRRRCERAFAKETMVDELESLYEEVLGTVRAERGARGRAAEAEGRVA